MTYLLLSLFKNVGILIPPSKPTLGWATVGSTVATGGTDFSFTSFFVAALSAVPIIGCPLKVGTFFFSSPSCKPVAMIVMLISSPTEPLSTVPK